MTGDIKSGEEKYKLYIFFALFCVLPLFLVCIHVDNRPEAVCHCGQYKAGSSYNVDNGMSSRGQ